MEKLVRGIIEFRANIRPGYREKFAQLALGQSPDALFIACCDSRVVPNLFASTDPGDLFVIRNVGNLIPACGRGGHSSADESEAAAIEFALMKLNVDDIVVCGHSECGAMQALLAGRDTVTAPNLRSWLRHGDDAMARLATSTEPKDANVLSRLNVLQQVEHLKTYPVVWERFRAGKLRLHAWFFELKSADVHAYDEEAGKFVLLDEKQLAKMASKA